MFQGFDEQRLLAMTDKERRWLDNVKKAFFESDLALKNDTPEDRCLEELLKAIDTTKTLRRSLRGEDCSARKNKKRFVEFLGLEIPAARPGGLELELFDRETGQLRKFTFGEIVYAIRCMIHENENLNAAEAIDYHVLLDWSVRSPAAFAEVRNGTFVCNGYFLWNRLREVLAKFITGIEAMIAFAKDPSFFSMTCQPDIGSIRPLRKKRISNKTPNPT